MKGLMIITLLIFSISCGKEKKKIKNTTYSLSTLQSHGVNFYGNSQYYGNVVTVTCTSNGSTNQQRITELTNLKNSIGLDKSNSINYTFTDVSLTPAQMSTLLTSAIQSLSYGNPQSTSCPTQILAQSI